MVFELFIQHYIDDGQPDHPVAGKDIAELEFHGLMQNPSSVNIPGTSTYRLTHTTGVPWLLAELDTPLVKPARIRLALSHGNYRFARAFSDIFEFGLELAQHLNAYLVEGQQQQLIDAATLEKILDPESEYTQFQLQHWHKTLSEINANNLAPLEFPLGHLDWVREYFCLSVLPSRRLTPDNLAAELDLTLRLRDQSTNLGALYDAGSQRLISKILFRDDGKIQLQPFYWKEPFSRAAAETLEIAETIAGKFDGKLFFFTQPLTEEFKETLRLRLNSLGIDFYWWAGELFRKLNRRSQ